MKGRGEWHGEGSEREGGRETTLVAEFRGSEDTPTTAKYGAAKNARAAASVAIVSVLCEREMGGQLSVGEGWC